MKDKKSGKIDSVRKRDIEREKETQEQGRLKEIKFIKVRER